MFSGIAVPDQIKDLGVTLGIDPASEDAMQVAWRVLEPRAGLLIDRFYEHPAVKPQFAALDPDRVVGLKRAQEEHWRELFLSRLSPDYEARVRRVAIAHRRIGLPMHHYLMAYFIMGNVLADEIRETFADAPDLLVRVLVALPRYIALDVAMTVRVYDAVTLDP